MKTKFSTLGVLFIAVLVFSYQRASAQNWLTAGNNLVGGELLGSLNGQPVNIVTNGSSRIYVTPTGNVGIGTTTPAATAALDVLSTTKGILIPRMNTAQRDAILSPGVGLNIYNTDSKTINIYNGSNWQGVLIPSSLGLVAIGVNAPSDNLTIGSPTPGTNLTQGFRTLNAGSASIRSIFTQNATTGAFTIHVDQGQNGNARAFILNVGAATNAMYVNGSGAVGVGTATPAATAILDLTSTTKGVLLPRMTTAQRNAIPSPATGLLIYQTDGTPGFYYYNGAWNPINASLLGANVNLSNLIAPTAVNVDLLPGATNATDLGSSAKNWRNLYLGGDANLSAGNVNFTSSLQTIQFPTVPTTTNNSMISMFSSGTQNKDRMVIAHSPAYTNWGLQYQDSLDKFNFLSGGTPVFTTDLGSWRVGVGTSSPATRLDIAGTGSYNLASSEGDFRLGDSTYRLKMGVANAGGGAGDAYIASSNRLYLGTSNVFGRTQTMSINNNGRVGIGTFTPAARLQVVGDTGTTVPAIQATVSYVGSSDVRGVTSFSKPSDGWGYGVEGTGGFIGGYFSALSGAYTGTGFGVYGTSSGTAGTRIGVYGTASGGTVNNWGGYFPTKTYTSDLRVGGEKGATGYVASINGKLIATEVRVEAIASWPDYVFGKGYKLMGLEELEARINAEKHLPGIPAASEVKGNGIMLGEMQTKTMEKVEESTLYIIQLNNKIKELEKKIDELTKKIK